ncbi:MAG: triose-phosphate isomerase [Hyphomicrobiaceae bacterium]|nr:triose-phosphate isomerase [Hyphomicrobiaceae bacterium]
MPMALRRLLVGNWKMNGLKGALTEAAAVADGIRDKSAVDVMICPPATLISAVAVSMAGSRVAVGAQDCHAAASGAFTGDVSAEMVADAGAAAVIVGHSERRSGHGELDRDVRAKTEAAHRAGLMAIVCVGETLGQRKAGLTETVVRRQLAGSLPDGATAGNTVVAYEPVWAIGSGLTPSVADVTEIHRSMAEALAARFGEKGRSIRLLYGGSVKASNAKDLMAIANVHGGLVGGASLKAADFLGILAAFE